MIVFALLASTNSSSSINFVRQKTVSKEKEKNLGHKSIFIHIAVYCVFIFRYEDMKQGHSFACWIFYART